MTPEQKTALKKVVDYLYADEFGDWSMNGHSDDHIFTSIMVLESYLNTAPCGCSRPHVGKDIPGHQLK